MLSLSTTRTPRHNPSDARCKLVLDRLPLADETLVIGLNPAKCERLSARARSADGSRALAHRQGCYRCRDRRCIEYPVGR